MGHFNLALTANSDQQDLTPDQSKLLAQLMKDITHG